MSKDWGIKISQPGKDVLTCLEKELVFSSKYQTLHVHSQGSGSVTDSGGRSVTINHGLGYVPKFLVHTKMDDTGGYGDANSFFISPYSTGGSGISGNLGDRDVISWADSSNLYIKFGDGFGYKEFHTGTENNNYGSDWHGHTYVSGIAAAGIYSDSATDAAIRVTGVNIAQGTSIYKASLMFYVSGTNGSGNKPVKVYGIDEDNTSDFGSSPFGRDKTTAVRSETIDSGIGTGEYWSPDVTDEVQEILNRNGWSSGNAMGFLIFDNGTTGSTNRIYDQKSGIGATSYSYLKVLMSNTLASYKYTIFLDKIE